MCVCACVYINTREDKKTFWGLRHCLSYICHLPAPVSWHFLQSVVRVLVSVLTTSRRMVQHLCGWRKKKIGSSNEIVDEKIKKWNQRGLKKEEIKGVNNTRGWWKNRNSGITIPTISPFFFFPPHIQGLSSFTDSPSPSSTPLTQAPAGCLYSHHPTRSPGEKFSLCIFIVVAHTNTVPHESFISLSFSLVLTLFRHIWICG